MPMRLSEFFAEATTCEADPGAETVVEGELHVRGRTFIDTVISDDGRIDGKNRLTVDLIMSLSEPRGRMHGTFALTPKAEGSWAGALIGTIEGGRITAYGLARGVGAFQGRAMRVDFRQVDSVTRQAACPEPLAFFQMNGFILGAEVLAAKEGRSDNIN